MHPIGMPADELLERLPITGLGVRDKRGVWVI